MPVFSFEFVADSAEKPTFVSRKNTQIMMLIHSIKELLGIDFDDKVLRKGLEMQTIGRMQDAFVLIKNQKIHAFGEMGSDDFTRISSEVPANEQIDASGRLVFPAFCDSHTHLVYPASREIEYVDKINGLSYEEIAKRGGGILNSAQKMQQASEEQLYEHAWHRLEEIIRYGTGAVEIKSGYGLTTEAELKMLRVIRRLRNNSPLTIRSTFLGAHAVPMEYRGKQSEYVDLIINEMIPMVAGEDLADYIDVFCDKGFFTEEDTDRILNAGMKYGLRPKIHANELDFSGGIQVGVKYNALSVDHLEYTGDAEIEALKGTETISTILPGAAFFLNMPYAPARKMIDSGLAVAMASDFNPGSSPSGNMQLILSMASILYRLTPEEGMNACTINGAYAMGISEELGSVTVGKKANLLITQPIPGLEYLPYYYGTNKVEKVILNGELQ